VNQTLSTATLKTGERLEIRVVLAPDAELEPLVKPFLGHKPSSYIWHMEAAFEPGRIDDLETRFYLGLLGGRPIANVMTVEYKGIGILGHVYTLPEHRRKGACALVMAEQMEDFRRRGGRFLTLGTGYDTPPYRIYRNFGFQSVTPESGFMKYETAQGFESAFFETTATTILSPQWKDWPVVNMLCAQPGETFVRSVAAELFGPRNFEGGYITLLRRFFETPACQARLLHTDRGAVAGVATLLPDARWHYDTLILDLFVHPNFTAYAHPLLQAMALPGDRKIQCHTEEDTAWKIAVLLEEGFEHEATFRGQINANGREVDVEVYERRG